MAGFDSGFQGRYFATRHIRANAAIQRGEGGAPLLNMNGEVVGVLISTVDGGSGLFVLPSDAAEKILGDYRAHGRIRPGWLGADVRITDAPEHGSSARLRALRAEGPGAKGPGAKGPGAKGHLRPGDVLLQVGSWKIQSPEDVLYASFYITAGSPCPPASPAPEKSRPSLSPPPTRPMAKWPRSSAKNPTSPAPPAT